MGAAIERNRLLQELAAFCETHPIDEKILLVPSFAVGTQVLDALARSGCAHLNLRPATVFSLAHEVAGPGLAAERRRLLSRAQLLAVVESACDEVLSETSYFGKLRERVGLHRALQRTLEELRHAGLGAAPLPVAAFEDARKARELGALALAYEASLRKMGAADAAEVLQRATVCCTESGPAVSASTFVLRPDDLDLAPLEERFLAACAPALVPLATDSADGLRMPSTLAFVHARGEENEVRGVFRTILDEKQRLDSVEVVLDDDATYRPLLYELASQYGIPCSFGEGIPVSYTRPGQGVLDYLDWVAHDFPAAALERLLADGRADLRTFSAGGARVYGMRAARLLRRARIFAGASRYASRLDGLVERERAADPEEEPGSPEARARVERLAVAETLRAFVRRLVELTPKPAKERLSLPALASACRDVVKTLLAKRSALDGAAADALAGLFHELGELPERRLPAADAAGRMREAVLGLAVESATPIPGHLHVARLERAGYAGRRLTFVLGLDEARFPGSARQDPVLLDSEREALNRAVPAARLPLPGRARAEESRRALRGLLARLRGRAVLSFSNRDILQDAERFPSPVLLDLYRERENRPEAGYPDLAQALGTPAAFIPASDPLDETDWWLGRLQASAGAAGLAREVESAYPWLGEGARAEESRASEAFTPWDGLISADPADLDPRRTRQPLSASRLERLAKCPRQYFFQYVLGLTPPEEDRPLHVWLTAREFGNLLHEVLDDFMCGLRADGLRLDPSRDGVRLRFVAGTRLARWREMVPPPNQAALRAQEGELFAACDIFLRSEAANGDATPRFFEVPFGLDRGKPDEPLASRDPVEIRTGRASFLLQGQIDRIDETGPGRYAVWDYKSGGDFAFQEEDRVRRPLLGGRRLQHALYARAAAVLLARTGASVSAVTSGYFFPTRRGKGRRFVPEADPADVDATLDDLFDLVSSGAFPHTADPKDCSFCPFRPICGDVERAAEQARMKLAAGDELLRPVRAIDERGV